MAAPARKAKVFFLLGMNSPFMKRKMMRWKAQEWWSIPKIERGSQKPWTLRKKGKNMHMMQPNVDVYTAKCRAMLLRLPNKQLKPNTKALKEHQVSGITHHQWGFSASGLLAFWIFQLTMAMRLMVTKSKRITPEIRMIRSIVLSLRSFFLK